MAMAASVPREMSRATRFKQSGARTDESDVSTSATEPSPTAPERMHLRLVDDAEVALVLVCGEGDVAIVTTVAQRIDVEQTRVITAADRGLDEMRQAVTCAQTPTLFVVCRTASFDAAKARRAVECFGARRVLSHRLLVVELDPKRPGAWTTTVGKAHAAMRRAQTIASDAQRDPAMVDSADRDAVQGETTRTRRMTPPPVLESGKSPVMVAQRVPEATGGDEDLKSWWRDEVGPIPAHVRRPEPQRAKLEVVDSKQTQDDGPASISDADLKQTRDDAAAAQTIVNTVVTPSRVARIVALAVVILVVLGFAIAPVLGASRGPRVEVPMVAPVGLVSSIVVIAEDPPKGGSVAIVPVAVPVPTIEVEAAPVTEIGDPLDRALADGRVARYGDLDLVLGPDRLVDWYGAANHCRARNVDGVSDFRLPSVEELRMLRRGDVAPPGAVWSGTRVVAERGKNWVLETRGTMTAQDKHDGRALVVCVRGR